MTAKEHYGFRDKSIKAPVDDNTIFHWASINELRKVHNRFGSMDDITIKQLLSHSAGFRAGTWPFISEGEKPGDKPWQPFEPPAWAQLVAMMPYTEVDLAPGTKYSYSNPGYVYLGRVIEDVMQEPWENYVDKEILKPLGMTRAFFDQAPSFLGADKSHSYFVSETPARLIPRCATL